MPFETLIYALLFLLFGIVIGSFLNVCICRIPKEESLMINSHCVNCNTRIKWYDLIPVFSYLFLQGKCRYCKTKISVQYPFIELMNGFLYIIILLYNGLNYTSIIYCLCTSALIVLSVIDFRTYEIPFEVNLCILFLAVVQTILNKDYWTEHVIGFFAVSGFLWLVYLITKRRGIGMGDIRLMAVCGLLVGYKLIILSCFIGFILGSIIHPIRMITSKEGRMLALGPYLSVGVYIAFLWGEEIVNWYLSFFVI